MILVDFTLLQNGGEGLNALQRSCEARHLVGRQDEAVNQVVHVGVVEFGGAAPDEHLWRVPGD